MPIGNQFTRFSHIAKVAWEKNSLRLDDLRTVAWLAGLFFIKTLRIQCVDTNQVSRDRLKVGPIESLSID